MRFTGYAVLTLGLLIALFSVALYAQNQQPMTPDSVTGEEVNRGYALPIFIPGTAAALAIGAGIGLIVYGRQGVIVTPDPAVRN